MPPGAYPTSHQGSLQALLRPNDTVAAVSPCRLRTSFGRVQAEVTILAHAVGGTEEAAVLVVSAPTDHEPVRVLRALPIKPSFKVAMMQIPPSPSTSYFAQSSKPHIEVSVSTGPGRAAELQFPAGDAVRVQALVKELRKAVAASFSSPTSHAWLNYYAETEASAPSEPAKLQAVASLQRSFGKLGTSGPNTDDKKKPKENVPKAVVEPLSEEASDDGVQAKDDTEVGDLSRVTEADESGDLDDIKVGSEDGSEAEGKDKNSDTEPEASEDLVKEELGPNELAEAGKAPEEPKVSDVLAPAIKISSPTDDKESPNGNGDVPAAASGEQSGIDSEDEDRYPNPYLPGFSRLGFLRKRIFAREAEWTTTHPISIRLVTYNVNDRVPPPGTTELGPLVGHGSEDIIVVGLQEADLRTGALLVSQGNDRAAAWGAAIFNGLGDTKDCYEQIASVQYVGVLMIVLVRSELRPDVRLVSETARGIGLLGFGGNKAGVAVRMKVHGTVITVVNCHLAAFANQLGRRRLDYEALRSGLTFPVPSGVTPSLEAYYNDDGTPLLIDDSDVVFWMGDLNYRVELEDKEIRALLDVNDFTTILTADQLSTDIADGLSFEGFSEPRITFRPSYKYVHGSKTLDPKRAPAYTDRILHLSNGIDLKSTKYTSHELLWSDHLPVSSVYSVDVRVAIESKRNTVAAAVQSELDKLDEQYRASLSVQEEELDFGQLTYGRQVTRVLTLHNTGRVNASYSFRVPSPGKPICKPWFWPFPATGMVPSGETVTLDVTAFVDDSRASDLTTGADVNDVLVLQIEGGKDSFISLRAQFMPTIVGLPLELLPDLSAVIRDLPLAQRKVLLRPPESEYRETSPTPKGTKPPREVWRLLEALMGEGPGSPQLWTGDVDQAAVLDVIDALDSGAEKLPEDAPAIAAALLHILFALPTKLVPESQRAACKVVRERDDAFGVVEKIPSVYANVLIGLMSVVKLCAGAEAVDDATVNALAVAVFGSPPAGRESFVRALLEG